MCKGIISIINGIVFAMDAIFTFRQKKQPLIYESEAIVNGIEDDESEVDDSENIKDNPHVFAFKITYLKTQQSMSEDQRPKLTQ